MTVWLICSATIKKDTTEKAWYKLDGVDLKQNVKTEWHENTAFSPSAIHMYGEWSAIR